jgi:hypothetical protein
MVDHIAYVLGVRVVAQGEGFLAKAMKNDLVDSSTVFTDG